MLTREDYDWVKVHLPFSGTPTQKGWLQPKKFIEFQQLGVGETSQALRAVTEQGHECVIKMYVRMFEDKVLLDKKEFNGIAKKSVVCELQCYMAVYPELKQYVWTTELIGFPCIILPYFKPVEHRLN